MQKLLLILFFLILALPTMAQNFWQDVDERRIALLGERQIIPNDYETIQIDVNGMFEYLQNAPERFTPASKNQQLILNIPNPDGSGTDYKVFSAPMMESELATHFSDIKTFVGVALDEPSKRIRFDLTPKGFHGMIRSAEGMIYIDPYSSEDTHNYVCYYKHNYDPIRDNDFTCHFVNDRTDDNKTSNSDNLKSMAGDCQLRTYRLAVATTGEYTTYQGGSVGAMSAVVTAINRVNEVYESDLSITLVLINNNNLLIQTSAVNDPYTNTDGYAMLGQNQTTVDNIIGSANYDIGHVFSTGGGGVAFLASVCNNSGKASGVTGLPTPVGDPFYIDYVAHEMGHQFGANHTFNNSCQDNRNGSTAMEPGSGSTIMGYAGICPSNVQNNSDPYFHAISLQEISSYILGGSSCEMITNTGNNKPIVTAGLNYSIPISTPFVLTASGNDPDGDALTYCWEQMNNQVSTQPPVSSSTGGPTFRSLDPSTSPSRYFPSIDNVVYGTDDPWEVLPSVSRTMNFRVTGRDNNQGSGCTDEDDTVISTTSNAGPFLVNSPSGVAWSVGANETVTWDVANTNNAPVSCANVDILLSTDGGFTYPLTLASNVSNDGIHTVVVPYNISSTCRVMVACANNVFYNISEQDFSIQYYSNICSGNNATFNIPVSSVFGFSNAVTLSVANPPTGTSIGFSSNPVSPGNTSTLTVSNTSGLTNGTYLINITATDGTQTQNLYVDLIVGTPPVPILQSPTNGLVGAGVNPVFSWDVIAGADSYNIEIATDPNFTNIIDNTTGIVGANYMTTATLSNYTNYYWRVTAVNTCGASVASASFAFQTEGLVYCTASGNTVDEWIQSVTVADLTNNSGNNGGYADFTNLSANVELGQSYFFSLTPGFAGPAYAEYWRIWIDYNRDGDFTDSGEMVYNAGTASGSTRTGYINIPNNVSIGAATMRVSMNYDNPQGPCDDLPFGEVEDYTINISSNCPDADNDGVCDADDLCPGADDNIDVNNNGTPDACEAPSVSIRLFLEGSFDDSTGQMDTDLNQSGVIPLNHPYGNPSTFNHTGSESLSSIPTDMVDWIYVEARSGLNNTYFIESKVGLLMRDGYIKGLDGISDLTFNLPLGGTYYFVVRHRNHLDMMTAAPVNRSLNMSYDFTTAPSQAYISVQKQLPSGVAVMFAGDIDESIDIQINDRDVWKSQPAQLLIYDNSDVNMDGQVQATDRDMWYINRSVNAPPEVDY